MFSELAKEVDLHRAGELWKKNPNLLKLQENGSSNLDRIFFVFFYNN